jgi:hypothetical protein
LSFQVFAFGLVATLQALQKGYGGYLASRIMLGVVECGYIPGEHQYQVAASDPRLTLSGHDCRFCSYRFAVRDLDFLQAQRIGSQELGLLPRFRVGFRHYRIVGIRTVAAWEEVSDASWVAVDDDR